MSKIFIVLIAATTALFSLSGFAAKPYFCNQKGVYSPCSKSECQQAQKQYKNNNDAAKKCKQQGLAWAGGDQCCPSGYQQVGCVANLPCQCKPVQPTTPSKTTAVLPPYYLSVPSWKACTGSKKISTYYVVCLTGDKPEVCPEASWNLLQEYGKLQVCS